MYETEIREAAAMLDERGPTGWRDRIDLDRLDMAISTRCILGQLYGTYSDGVDVLDLPGFGNIPFDFPAGTPDVEERYTQLAAEWVEFLTNEKVSV